MGFIDEFTQLFVFFVKLKGSILSNKGAIANRNEWKTLGLDGDIIRKKLMYFCLISPLPDIIISPINETGLDKQSFFLLFLILWRAENALELWLHDEWFLFGAFEVFSGLLNGAGAYFGQSDNVGFGDKGAAMNGHFERGCGNLFEIK
jgi:hypothetical protein